MTVAGLVVIAQRQGRYRGNRLVDNSFQGHLLFDLITARSLHQNHSRMYPQPRHQPGQGGKRVVAAVSTGRPPSAEAAASYRRRPPRVVRRLGEVIHSTTSSQPIPCERQSQ
jgi:hypothetical protein